MGLPLVLLDYGCGNLCSLQRSLERLGAEPVISNRKEELARSERLILPGVGHFGRAMENLRAQELLPVLQECAFERKIPILGICLGMQLMATSSQEGDSQGLGWLEASVVRLANRGPKFRNLHIGWNCVRTRRSSRLLSGISPNSEFYFVHNFHLTNPDSEITAGDTEYGIRFPSVIEQGNLFGVQFHPEKSHDAGGLLLQNFLEA